MRHGEEHLDLLAIQLDLILEFRHHTVDQFGECIIHLRLEEAKTDGEAIDLLLVLDLFQVLTSHSQFLHEQLPRFHVGKKTLYRFGVQSGHNGPLIELLRHAIQSLE